jgi:lysophospholipase L1-like esterase
LLVIGDSLSRGLYASSADGGYAYRLAGEMGAGLGLMPSCTLAGAEQGWAAWAWPADVIVVELGTNDAMHNAGCPQIDEREWAARYGAFLDTLQASGAPHRALGTTRVVVATIPWLGQPPEATARYNEYIASEARKRGITVVDLWTPMQACGADCLSRPDQASPFAPDFHGDGFHPNDEGHRLIAGALARAVQLKAWWLPLVY